MVSIVYYHSNQHERQDYTTDCNNSDFDNACNGVIVSISIENNHINSSSVYSDIDN